MSKCDTVGCRGHLGKYDDCLSEAIAWRAPDWARDQTGDVEAPCGYVEIVVIDEPETLTVDDHNDVTVTVPAGTYLVWTDNQGFVSVDHYADGAVAQRNFDAANDAYGVWLGDDE